MQAAGAQRPAGAARTQAGAISRPVGYDQPNVTRQEVADKDMTRQQEVRNATRTPAAAAVTALLVLSAALTPAAARDSMDAPWAQSENLPIIEITPFAGYRMGGDFELGDTGQDLSLESRRAFSLALNFPIDAYSQYELFYGRQETRLEDNSPFGPVDVDVEYLHIGGTVVLNEERRVVPYAVGTLGATRLTPDAVGTDEETRFSLSLGLGLRVPVSTHLSLRLEGRGFATFMNTQSSVFCASGSAGGFCSLRGRGDTFFQYEFLAGVAFSF